MRVLVVHPGPDTSVCDVYNGWIKGLRANGCEIIEYDLSSRLWLWSHAHLWKKETGEYIPAMDLDTAVEMAQEALGTWLYDSWPDLVLFVSAFWANPAQFDRIRSRHRIALLCTESPYEDDRQLDTAAHVDITLLNDPTHIDRFRAACPVVEYFPHSYDPQVHKPGRPDPKRRSDLCIVGSGFPSRVQFLEQMDLDGIDVALLGNWGALDDADRLAQFVKHRPLNKGVTNRVAVRCYQSTRASLNLYRREANRPELSAGWAMGPREVELAATGTFFLSESRGENADVLPMVPKIDGPEDASEQLRWWLAHDRERRRVAREARAAVDGWTFENRAAEFLRLVDKIPARSGH